MESVTSAFFVDTEDLEMFGFSELEDICEDLDLVKLCDEFEAKQKPHLVDPSYDDELYKFLLWLKKIVNGHHLCHHMRFKLVPEDFEKGVLKMVIKA
ncbi:unnamed protein product, partial [Brenthis ino]